MHDQKQVFESLNTAIFRYCRYRLNSQADAEDCTSEVFSRWLASDNAPTDLNSLRPWMFGVARNVLAEKYRELAKNKGEIVAGEESDDSTNIEMENIDQELLKLIKKEIKNLDEEAQEVLTLKIWEEMSFKQIAEIIQKSENTVKTTYYRSLEEIKVKLNSKSTKMRAVGLPIIIVGIQAMGSSAKLQVSAGVQATLWQNAALQSKTLTIKESFMQNIKNWVGAHKILVSLVCGLIILSVLLAAALLAAQQNSSTGNSGTTSSSAQSSSSSTTSASTTSSVEAKTKFTGKFITAELPAGWMIKEYEGEEGDLSMTVRGPNISYSGFTTMEIINPANEVLFKAKVVGGVGGYGCADIAKFSDTPQAYIDGIVAENKGYNINTQVFDYSKTAYTETKLVNMSYRRVADQLYYDWKTDIAGFQPACGLSENMYKLSAPFGYKQTVNGNTGGTEYEYEVTTIGMKDKPETELVKLDAILNSIKAK